MESCGERSAGCPGRLAARLEERNGAVVRRQLAGSGRWRSA